MGLTLLSGVRRCDVFALRWIDLDEQGRCLRIREAVYEGAFDSPKTEASAPQIPLSAAAMALMADWRARAKDVQQDRLVFSTWSGKPISPNNVLRQQVYSACEALGSNAYRGSRFDAVLRQNESGTQSRGHC